MDCNFAFNQHKFYLYFTNVAYCPITTKQHEENRPASITKVQGFFI